ncbi:MAG: VTT domain-containing protein [Nitrospinota bacterium]
MHFLHRILGFISAHPLLAYGAIFLNSLADSLPLIGILIPGSAIIFGVGIVVATGVLSLKPVILVAIAGAIVGDGIGYWFGRHYKRRLLHTPPSSRYASMLERGERYFRDHGGKSVFLARFIGPLRPVIPIVAGMSGMEPIPFSVINIISAIGWAFAYILPGLFFGSSLEVAGAISTRLVILILIVVGSAWGFVVISKMFLSFFEERGPHWFSSFRVWAKTRTSPSNLLFGVKRFISFLIYRKEGEEILLLLLGGLLLAAGWGFLGILQDVLFQDPLVMADKFIYYFLQSLRTPWGDSLFVAITELGDASVNIFIAASILIILLVKRCYRTAKYWIVAVVGGAFLIEILKLVIHLPRPIDIYQGALSYGFPSGHTTMSVILYGFLALIIARGTFRNFRWGFFAGILLFPFMISISRLYLGAHWLSDVVGGFFVGIVWVSILGISYLKHANEQVPRRMLAIATLVTIVIAGGWHIGAKHLGDISFYATRHKTEPLTVATWKDDGWRKLSTWRIDMAGEEEQPLNIQWGGTIEELSAHMIKQGWSHPAYLSTKAFMAMLSPSTPIEQLPVLPRLHKGRRESLLLVQHSDKGRLVLRLWPGDAKIIEGDIPIFVGTIEEQIRHNLTGLITIAKDSGRYKNRLAATKEIFPEPFNIQEVVRSAKDIKGVNKSEKIEWDGEVFLICQRELCSE